MTIAQAHAADCSKCRSSHDVHETSFCAEARDIAKAGRIDQVRKPAATARSSRNRRSRTQARWCSDCGDIAVTSCYQSGHEAH